MKRNMFRASLAVSLTSQLVLYVALAAFAVFTSAGISSIPTVVIGFIVGHLIVDTARRVAFRLLPRNPLVIADKEGRALSRARFMELTAS